MVYFRPTQICNTPLLTYAKSDIIARGFTTAIGLLEAAIGPLACPSRGAGPRNCPNPQIIQINSCRRSDVAVGRKVSSQKFSKGDVT